MSNPSEIAALVTASNNLTQAVINHRSEINNTVDTEIRELNAWKNALTPPSIAAEPRYLSTIDLTGLSTDRYYPVWWFHLSNDDGVLTISITRNYARDRELDPFGTGGIHVAGLLMELEQVAHLWSGDACFLHMKRLSQTYRKTVRKLGFAMKCHSVEAVPGYSLASWANSTTCPMRSGVYLRGGLTYTVLSNQIMLLSHSKLDTPVEIYSEVRSTANGQESGRWMVKSYHKDDPFLGDEYDDFMAPYAAFPYAVN